MQSIVSRDCEIVMVIYQFEFHFFLQKSKANLSNVSTWITMTLVLEYAGKRVRYALIVVDLFNRRPIEVVRDENAYLDTFY